MKMCRTGGHVLDRSSLEQYTTLLTVGSVGASQYTHPDRYRGEGLHKRGGELVVAL